MTTTPKLTVRDDIKWSCEYEVTLTLSPFLYCLNTELQTQKAIAAYNFCISPYINSKMIKVSAVLEETKGFNIHIHSIVQVKLIDRVTRYGIDKFLTNMFRNKNFGRERMIQQVKDANLFRYYILKDYSLARRHDYYISSEKPEWKFMEREYYPIIRDDHEILHIPRLCKCEGLCSEQTNQSVEEKSSG